MKNTKMFKCQCVPSVVIQVYSTHPHNFMSNLNGWTLMIEGDETHRSPLEIKDKLNLTDTQQQAMMSEANRILLNLGSMDLVEII